MVTKILVLASNPEGTEQLKLNREIRLIEDALEKGKQREKFTVKPKLEVRPEDLQQTIRQEKPRIVHFCGHGAGSQGLVVGKESGQKQLVGTQAIADLFKLFDNQVEFVVLNACYSQVQAAEINQHINYVIGTKKEIKDDAAIAFSTGFYEALGDGESIERAYQFGCNRIQLAIYGRENQGRKLVPVYSEEEGDWINLPQQEVLRMLKKEPRNQIEAESEATKKKAQSRDGLLKLLAMSLKVSVFVTFVMIVVRFLGILQPLELWFYDSLMQYRVFDLSKLSEPPDDRLLIIEIDEEDRNQEIKSAKERGEQLTGTISDSSLVRLLKKLEKNPPRVIGLDLYRDGPISKDLEELFKNNNKLFAVCKVPDATVEGAQKGFEPPANVPEERIGFSDFVSDDRKDTVRRHLLIMNLELDKGSRCTSKYALSLVLAKNYLESKQIKYKDPLLSGEDLQFGDVVLKRFRPPYTGGYQKVDWQGYQILLNYRRVCRHNDCSLRNIVKKGYHLNLRDVVDTKRSEKGEPKNRLEQIELEDKIVVIASAFYNQDYWYTPYQEKVPGFIIQAQMVSQILSAVLEDQRGKRRLLLESYSFGYEALWIGGCSCFGVVPGVLTWLGGWGRRRGWTTLVIFITFSAAGIWLFCLVMLSGYGKWIPLVPPVLAVVMTGSIIYIRFKFGGE